MQGFLNTCLQSPSEAGEKTWKETQMHLCVRRRGKLCTHRAGDRGEEEGKLCTHRAGDRGVRRRESYAHTEQETEAERAETGDVACRTPGGIQVTAAKETLVVDINL